MSDLNSPQTQDLPILDYKHLSALDELSDPNDSLINELSKIFSSTTPNLLSELKNAVERDDQESIRRLAHRLKGSAANLGARRMAAQCAELERQSQNSKSELNLLLLLQIEENFKASEQALKKFSQHPL